MTEGIPLTSGLVVTDESALMTKQVNLVNLVRRIVQWETVIPQMRLLCYQLRYEDYLSRPPPPPKVVEVCVYRKQMRGKKINCD